MFILGGRDYEVLGIFVISSCGAGFGEVYDSWVPGPLGEDAKH